jgi:hypothetical protein
LATGELRNLFHAKIYGFTWLTAFEFELLWCQAPFQRGRCGGWGLRIQLSEDEAGGYTSGAASSYPINRILLSMSLWIVMELRDVPGYQSGRRCPSLKFDIGLPISGGSLMQSNNTNCNCNTKKPFRTLFVLSFTFSIPTFEKINRTLAATPST